MSNDPNDLRFQKDADVSAPRGVDQFAAEDRGKARAEFGNAKSAQGQSRERAKQDQNSKGEDASKDDTRSPVPPAQNFTMKGPAGTAVISEVARQKAMERAKQVQARAQTQEKEKGAQQARAQGEKQNLPKNEGKGASEAGKDASRANLVERVKRLEIANQAKNLAKSKDEFEK